mgnify:CR=1 FL=1
MKDNHLEVSGKTCCPTCGQTLPEPKVSVEILEELFDYNPLTGFLTNKYRPRKYFTRDNNYTQFNLYRKGKRAGGFGEKTRTLNLLNKKYMEHRVIWALYYKEWPSKGLVIDHINGDPFDNRIHNLRLVTIRENAMNTKLSSKNKSGVTGVSLHGGGKWQSKITSNGKSYYLGLFSNFDDAVKARKQAETKYGFHENHGRDGTIDG